MSGNTPYNAKAQAVFLVNQEDGSPYMAGTDVASSVQVTGAALTAMQLTATEIGPVNAAAVIDPTASASTNALLKGILTELLAANVLLQTIADNTAPT